MKIADYQPEPNRMSDDRVVSSVLWRMLHRENPEGYETRHEWFEIAREIASRNRVSQFSQALVRIVGASGKTGNELLFAIATATDHQTYQAASEALFPGGLPR